MENKSDKPTVVIIMLACIGVILLFHFAWYKYLVLNYNHLLFTAGDIVLLILFGITCVVAYKNADDPNYDIWWKLMISMALASSVWAAAWSTGLMNNLSQGI
jgi:hypothetical protein